MPEQPPHRHPDRPSSGRPPGARRRRSILQHESSRPVLGFLIRFGLAWAAALAAATLFPDIERWAIGATMWTLKLVVMPFAHDAVITGSMLRAGGATVQIVSDCTPLMPTATLWAAVVAFPATWRWRLTGLVAGAAIIWVYNVVRILALLPVLAFRPEWFEFIHVYLWQTVTLIVVFMCFLAWLRLQPAERSEP
jgi:exosortase/archaeosortase family protein